MKFEGLHIWMISPEPWGINFLSKHHYALELAQKGNFITFIEPADTEHELQVAPEHPQIRLLPWKSSRGQRHLPRLVARKLQQSEGKKIQAITRHAPDVIWSFDNSRLFHLDALAPGAFKLHHVVDLNQDFQLREACESADLGLCTTRFILEKMHAYLPNTHVLHHGCQLRQVASWQPHHRKPTVMYVGNLMIPLLDRQLLLDAIEAHPEVAFRLVGSYGRDNLNQEVPKEAVHFVKTLMAKPNVTLTGALSQSQLDRELSKADMFVIAYREEEHEQVANPHKVMELLSTGRPILSNFLDAFSEEQQLITMTKDRSSWLTAFSSMLQRIPELNSRDQSELRQRFAAEHTYSAQLDQIEKLIAHE
jgi:glycosyltransferase involved in cell wall biosynthesis